MISLDGTWFGCFVVVGFSAAYMVKSDGEKTEATMPKLHLAKMFLARSYFSSCAFDFGRKLAKATLQ